MHQWDLRHTSSPLHTYAKFHAAGRGGSQLERMPRLALLQRAVLPSFLRVPVKDRASLTAPIWWDATRLLSIGDNTPSLFLFDLTRGVLEKQARWRC